MITTMTHRRTPVMPAVPATQPKSALEVNTYSHHSCVAFGFAVTIPNKQQQSDMHQQTLPSNGCHVFVQLYSLPYRQQNRPSVNTLGLLYFVVRLIYSSPRFVK